MLRVCIVVFAVLLTTVGSSELAMAASQGFRSTATNIQQGMVLRYGQVNSGEAELQPATRDDATQVVGVATNVPKEAAQKNGVVFVETSGAVVALVTDKNGPVVPGDNLTLSDVPGVLTKAVDGQAAIFAIAKQAYDPQRAQVLQFESGSASVVALNVDFGPANAGQQVDPASSGLRQFGEGLAHRDLSEVRLIFAFLLCLAVIVTTSVMMYGAISRALFSIGRNPLAKRTILLVMLRIIGLALVCLSLGLVGVYLVLAL